MRKALVKLHVAVFLAGFTGVLGKCITLAEVPLVWWRMLFVVAVLYPMLRLKKAYWRPRFRGLLTLYGIGGILALSWILFYASIKASTVSVALVCLSLMGFFTAVLSPPILKTAWSPREFVYSALTILGIGLIFHFDTQYRLGVVLGCLAAALSALYVICNKKYASHYSNQNLVFYHENCGGYVIVTLSLAVFFHLDPAARFLPSTADLVYLLILAVLCTVVMYVLQLEALQTISPFTVNLSFNLEPIYSIILAALFLGEGKTLTLSFYAGLGLIFLSVALQTVHVLRSRAITPASEAQQKRNTQESVRRI